MKSTGSYKAEFAGLEVQPGCQQVADGLQKSPLTIAINARQLKTYKSGIFNSCPENEDVNHDIYLVGVTDTYWKLKNSWGVRWGEYGYLRVASGNTCKVCSRGGLGLQLK